MPEQPSRPSGPEQDPVHDGPAGAADLEVHISPRSSASRIVGPYAGRLKIQLAAPPVDGAANAALVDFLADTLDVSRSQVAIVRGHTDRRKTVRVADLAAGELRRRLGLVALHVPLVASLLAAPACESEVPFSIKVVLPDETDSLARANNAALELTPGGAENFEIDGLDFSIEVKLEPDDVQRTLSLYLAEGETLLAWGRSAPFILSAPVDGLAVLVAPPGQLSSFRGTITEPDPEIMVGVAPGRGAFMLDEEGHAALLNEFTLESDIAATLTADDDLPPPSDGALVPDTGGGIWRLAWAERLRGHRYDPGDDEWLTATYAGADPGARPGAAHLVDASLERVLLFGGGTHADIAQVDLVAGSDDTYTVELLEDPLDGPRSGATALYLTREASDDGEGVVLVGGDDPARPLGYFVATRQGLGPAEAWTGLQCAQLEPSPGADDEVRILCVGGLRGGNATTAALLLHFPPDSADKSPSLEILPDLVPDAPADPRLLADDRYLYAQYAGPGGGHWLRIDRADLTTTSEPGPALRARGGHSVSLGTGATFLLGGWTADDTAVDRWHVFVGSISTE